jgi:hypothetical protein
MRPRSTLMHERVVGLRAWLRALGPSRNRVECLCVVEVLVFEVDAMSASGHHASMKMRHEERPKAAIEIRRRALGRQRVVLRAHVRFPLPFRPRSMGEG